MIPTGSSSEDLRALQASETAKWPLSSEKSA
jgi:hypothetical protein